MKQELRIKCQELRKRFNTQLFGHNLTSYFLLLTSKKGFTFIELLLVMTILLILGTMSTAYTARFLTQNSVDNTTDQLVNSFRKAQMNAMMGKNASHWGVNYGSNLITLYRGNSYSARVAAVDEKFTVSGVTISGLTDINFWPKDGTPSASATITVTDNKGSSNTITVNSQGMVTK